MDADGVTPSHHLGYTFTHGKFSYFVAEQGWLDVMRGKKRVLHEMGTWIDDKGNG